jgi:uncharacterized protein
MAHQLRSRFLPALVVAAAVAAGASAQTPAQRLQAGGEDRLSIATGPTTGVYFHVGKFLCDLMTAAAGCSARVTTGSLANAELLRRGEVPFALVQSDVERASRAGDKADAALRVVAALHAELFTIVARADDPAVDIGDFRTRRLGAGPVGSGERASAERVLAALDWTAEERGRMPSIARPLAARALCEGRVDALLLMLGHPNNFSIDLGRGCAVRFVPLTIATIETLVARLPDFSWRTIPGGTYPALREDVATVGLAALVVTMAGQPDALVERLATRLVENAGRLGTAHPALARLGARDLVPDQVGGRVLHPAAARVYRERGLID